MADDYSRIDKWDGMEESHEEIASSHASPPIPQWQIDELRRRKELRQDSDDWGTTWEVVKQRLLERRLDDDGANRPGN